MLALKKLLLLIIKIIVFPAFIIIAILDLNVYRRLFNDRYTIEDFLPHCYSLFISTIIYFVIKKEYIILNYSKICDILPNIIEFQEIIFATALATSTYILSFLKPNELILKHPEKSNTILDTIDDLRLANKIIFISLLNILTIWLFLTLEIIQISVLIIILISFFLLWSVFAIKSIIKGVFELAKIN